MKKILALFTVLLFLLLVYLSWNWYKETVLCCDDQKVVSRGVLSYDCNTDIPITTEGWPQKKEEILTSIAEGRKLLVVAPYFDGETKELALARAGKVKELFLDKLTVEQIEIGTYAAGNCQESQSDVFHKSLFKWVIRNENVVEQHDRVLIYFEYNKTKEIDSENLTNYLAKLADDLKLSGKSINIVGHTDKDGDTQYNYNLGLERAEQIKKYLVNKGLEPGKITTDSKGETQPIADGSTEEGKQLNRRAEIEFN